VQAVVQQHPEVGVIVVDGGVQPAATALERRRPAVTAALGLVPDVELTGLRVGAYSGGSRCSWSTGTWNPVSFMPSGPKMRSRRNSSYDWPATLETSTPGRSLLIW
jgi:hypothetical protein